MYSHPEMTLRFGVEPPAWNWIMKQDDDSLKAKTASVIGDSVQRSSAFLISQLEDISLWMLEQASNATPKNKGLALTGRVLHGLHQALPGVPPFAGQIAEKSTYLGISLGEGIMRLTNKVLARTRSG
jgi:hypothetical protein